MDRLRTRLVAVFGALVVVGAITCAILIPSAGSGAASPALALLDSDGWAGQLAQSAKGFSGVTARWRVPRVLCAPGEDGSSYAWVGLGGWSRSALEQVGTAQWCVGGSARYGLFAEFYSEPPIAGDGSVYQPARYPVRPGDVITATVARVDGGYYRLSAHDESARWTFQRVGRSPDYDPRRDTGDSTAEVVMEEPGDDLPRYRPLSFSRIAYRARGSYSRALLRTVIGDRPPTQYAAASPGDAVTTRWLRRS